MSELTTYCCVVCDSYGRSNAEARADAEATIRRLRDHMKTLHDAWPCTGDCPTLRLLADTAPEGEG